MEIYQIIHFIAIVETGSFTKGADRAAVSQSAISASIAKLEAEFDVQLLDRRSPVVPTNAEAMGRQNLAGGTGPGLCHGRARRIEQTADGRCRATFDVWFDRGPELPLRLSRSRRRSSGRAAPWFWDRAFGDHKGLDARS
jgi:Bacterial regulatory helix-turn-helix protein, lysR family